MGWGLHMVPPLMLEGQVVSSTAIRTLLGAGAVRGAADLLGRNYSVPGELSGDELHGRSAAHAPCRELEAWCTRARCIGRADAAYECYRRQPTAS